MAMNNIKAAGWHRRPFAPKTSIYRPLWLSPTLAAASTMHDLGGPFSTFLQASSVSAPVLFVNARNGGYKPTLKERAGHVLAPKSTVKPGDSTDSIRIRGQRAGC